MFRFGARLIGVGGKRCQKNNNIPYILVNTPSLRLTEPVAQITSIGIAKRKVELCAPQIAFLTNSIQDLGFSENEVKLVIQSQPDLIKKPPILWNSVLGSLKDYGLSNNDILSILQRWPHILSLNKSELNKNLAAWFECGFGEELTYNVLTTHPQFLKVNNLTVQKRVKQYQIYFESKKRVGKLLLLAPNTLEEGLDQFLDKLNYLDELCTEKSDVVATGVLAHSPLHIRARHEFLIRAGIYKRPGKEFHKKLSKNPKLTDIVNTSDKEFAFKVAKLTLLEYEVFLEMYEKEYEESKEDLDLGSYDDEKELNKMSYKKHKKPSRR